MLCTATLAIPAAIFAEKMVIFWLRIDIDYSLATLLGLIVWVISSTYTGMLSPLLNAANKIREQVFWFSVGTSLSIALKIILIPKIGMAGAVWGTVLGYGVGFSLPITPVVSKLLRKSSTSNPKI
jgi:O-antigen/teichoic acid export membrane protein